MISNEEISRMRWASRRGMLELDLVLAPFVEACYAGLDNTDRGRFEQLVRCEDQELYAWLMGRVDPDDEELAAIVRKVLDFTRSPAASK